MAIYLPKKKSPNSKYSSTNIFSQYLNCTFILHSASKSSSRASLNNSFNCHPKTPHWKQEIPELSNTQGLLFLAKTNLLACLFPYHCYTQVSVFNTVVPACALSSCMQRPVITAESMLQNSLLFQNTYNLPKECSSHSVKVYFKRYVCIIQICEILSALHLAYFCSRKTKKVSV